MAEVLGGRLFAERAIGLQRAVVERQVVVEGDRVEAQVGPEGPLLPGSQRGLPHIAWSIEAERNGSDGCRA